MPGAVPPLSQYAFMAWCSVNSTGWGIDRASNGSCPVTGFVEPSSSSKQVNSVK
jgi:hypothetical protein